MNAHTRDAAEPAARPEHVLLVETRSSWESHDVDDFLRLPRHFQQTGCCVDIFLIQNGVLILQSPTWEKLAALSESGSCRIWIDLYSLRLRGLDRNDVPQGSISAGTHELVRLMARPDSKIIWHS